MGGRAAGLFGLAAVGVLVMVLATRADDKGSKKADQPKKEKPAPAAGFPDIDDLLKRLPAGLDDDAFQEVRKQMEEMRKHLRQLQKGGLMQRPFGFPGMPLGRAVRTPSAQEARLGAQLRQPSATLADQLDLPRDQGMVLEEVGANSAAAKAGMKAHDILLEIDGKAVSSKREEFDRLLEGIAANRKVGAVVMRKGKKEGVKDLTLPEVKPVARRAPGGFPAFPGGLGGGLFMQGLGGADGATTITRTNDEFTVRNRTDGVTITIKGSVEEGKKAQVSGVTIESAGKTKTYDSVDKVPVEHQEKVKKLAEMGARGGAFRLR
jgi:membrane-associated protease RseP (regulator of RpoE activity)